MNLAMIIIAFFCAIKTILGYNAEINLSDHKKLNHSGKIRLMNEFYDEASEEYEGKLFKKNVQQIFIVRNSISNLNDLKNQKSDENKVLVNINKIRFVLYRVISLRLRLL